MLEGSLTGRAVVLCAPYVLILPSLTGHSLASVVATVGQRVAPEVAALVAARVVLVLRVLRCHIGGVAWLVASYAIQWSVVVLSLSGGMHARRRRVEW